MLNVIVFPQMRYYPHASLVGQTSLLSPPMYEMTILIAGMTHITLEQHQNFNLQMFLFKLSVKCI